VRRIANGVEHQARLPLTPIDTPASMRGMKVAVSRR